MSRHGRTQFPGAVYHAMARGNRKSMIVVDDDDRHTFMTTLGDAARDCRVRMYASCLMGTHYHLLLDTPRSNLSEFMRRLNGEYSKAFNRRHQRVGHTFEQRFTSIVVQREKYLRRVARYIALNPVRAELCGNASDWPWSTHRATAGLEEGPEWLHVDWLRWAFRAGSLRDAQHRYRAYVQDPAGLTWSFELTAALGTPRFKRAISESRDRVRENRWLPTDGRRCAQPPLEDVFSGDPTRPCRDGLILVAHLTYGYRLSEIAEFLEVAPSTVSKGLRRARRRQSLAQAGSAGDDGRADSPRHLSRFTA